MIDLIHESPEDSAGGGRGALNGSTWSGSRNRCQNIAYSFSGESLARVLEGRVVVWRLARRRPP